MPVPKEPILFMKATSSHRRAERRPGDPARIARRPTGKSSSGVVIGKPAKYVSEADAMSHVAGYCVVHDVSERAYPARRHGPVGQGQERRHVRPDRPLARDGRRSARLPGISDLWLEVDGQRYQDGSTKTLVFGVPYLVSYLSQFMSLQPGDIISTGTPPGVGHGKKPPVYLRAGNDVRLGVEGLGEQHQRVVRADRG